MGVIRPNRDLQDTTRVDRQGEITMTLASSTSIRTSYLFETALYMPQEIARWVGLDGLLCFVALWGIHRCIPRFSGRKERRSYRTRGSVGWIVDQAGQASMLRSARLCGLCSLCPVGLENGKSKRSSMVEGCHRKRVENHGNQCHSRSDGTVGIFSPMLVIQDYYSLRNKVPESCPC